MKITIYDKAQEIMLTMEHVLADELRLQPPLKYQILKDGNFILLLAVMDVQNLRRAIQKYTAEDVLHQLSTALGGLPVVLSNHSGLRYAVSMTGKPRLLKMAVLPEAIERDIFPFGMSLRGPVHIHAAKMVNMLIGGSQGSGKSMVLRMLAHSARKHGAKLYLVDPVTHTFNPDVWDALCAMPVASKRGDLLKMLDQLEAEIERRTALFRAAAVRGIPPEDVDEYNALNQHEYLPRVHLIGDEMNTFLEDRLVREKVAELARQGRKWGLHVTMAAHNWRAEDISRGLSALFLTRLSLRAADDTSGKVVLNSNKWGRQTLRFRTPGRAVLFAEGQYQKVQLYYLAPEREREWLMGLNTPAPLPAEEATIVMRSLKEASGKMTQEFLMQQGLSDTGARKLAERYEARGWLVKDPSQGNARVVTEALRALLGPNHQTPQTSPSPYMQSKSSPNLNQTPYVAGA